MNSAQQNINTIEFTFAVMGDSRGKGSEQINTNVLGTLLSNLRKYHNPEFILFAGDMINGRWTSNFDPTTKNMIIELNKWKNFVMQHFPNKRANTFLYPSVGNHDVSNSQFPPESERAFNEVFNYLPSSPDSAEMLAGYGKTVYYFDYGNSRFITLNCRLVIRGIDQLLLGVLPRLREWLDSVLSSGERTHNFVMLHYPPYPAQNNEGLDQYQAADLWKIIDKYNATAVFAGHEHLYGRRIITDGLIPCNESSTAPTFYNTIPEFILGGAGAPLSALYNDTKNFIKGPIALYHYMVVTIKGSTVIYKIYDINESLIDSFVYDSTKGTNLYPAQI